MRIVINHLTRMQRGFMCVAGIDMESGNHIRPVVPWAQLPVKFLARHGGPFDMAMEVDIGETVASPQAPETEDHVFDPIVAEVVRVLDPKELWDAVARLARTRLSEIFGNDLTKHRQTCMVELGKGQASLGCLIPRSRTTLFLRERPEKLAEIRMRVQDGEFDLTLPVTDIRLFGKDHVTPDTEAVQRTAAYLAAGGQAILSVGLTRPFASSPESTAVHWLQVNNIHRADNPAWQLG